MNKQYHLQFSDTVIVDLTYWIVWQGKLGDLQVYRKSSVRESAACVLFAYTFITSSFEVMIVVSHRWADEVRTSCYMEWLLTPVAQSANKKSLIVRYEKTVRTADHKSALFGKYYRRAAFKLRLKPALG